tara:strand:- start:9625 stop:10332 length:708 start_codon:yes stop_codon:yes gene_type:complete
MATQYVIATGAAGRTLSAKLYNVSTSALVSTATVVAEDVATTGIYRCTFAESSALTGSHRIVLTDSVAGIAIAVWNAVLTGTDLEVVQAAEFSIVTGAGDATAASQAAILAKITPITNIYTSQPKSETLNLIRGDAYDGTSNSKLTWTASKSVHGQTVNFTIRDSKDSIVLDQNTTGVTATATGTSVEVSLSTAATKLLDPAVSVFKFDVEIQFSEDSRWTIAKGIVCVEGDVSR